MTITLTPVLEKALAQEAQQQGTTPELLALETLNKRFVPETLTEPDTGGGTLFDLIKDQIGTVCGSGENLSDSCGKHFTDGLVKKQRQGKL